MIIENPDLFKSWLTSILEPLCDAEPAALAKYVYALVKKDKPLEELRDMMIDQLDVFLQQETKPFLEMLFRSVESQEYLKHGRDGDQRKQSPPPDQAEMEKLPEENHAPLPAEPPGAVPNGPARVRSPRQRVVLSRGAPPPPPPPPHTHAHAHTRAPPPHEHTLVKVLPLTELLEEPVDQIPRRRDRRTDSMREKEERRRRRSRSWERRARARRRDEHRHEHRRGSRSASPRGRYRNRSPPVADTQPIRSRSRSPMPVRDRIRVVREMERDRMSRDRDHRDRLSRDRDRERSRERSRSHSRSGSPRPDVRPDISDAYKRRCRDFDEKGYCMRGDLCQWDHGADPLVLEDAALTRVLTIPPPVPEYNPLTPDIWCDSAAFPPYPHTHHHNHPPRELIPIPRVRHEPPPPLPGVGMPPAPLPRHPSHPPHPAHPAHPAHPSHPPPKKNFEYSRLGHPRPPLSANLGNCTLEVKKIPRGMNDITHLNNHFCKFGKIVNIQVCYEGDPEAALITFASPTDANVAYKSTEAVLNNRFIKVYWHNTENKQENVAPGGQPPMKAGDRNNAQYPMSHNKVLINRDNIKATHDTKQQNDKEKEIANGQEPKKEVIKPADKVKQASEMYKRAQALLESELKQQKLLINKLESGNVTEAQQSVLMAAINSSQEGIEKLREEVVKYGVIIKKMQDESVSRGLSRLHLSQANAKRPKTREEAEKEILDAEMDMFNKEQAGQDVTELVQKISELKRQMAIQFPVHPTIRRPHSRGGRFNTPSRFTRGGLTKMYSVNQSVDHRPRALLISGFEADELDALVVHFSQFGEVISKQVELSVPQLVLQYKCRAHAELAAAHGRHYNDRTLSITWVAKANPGKPLGGAPPSVPAPSPANMSANMPANMSANTLANTPAANTPARNGDAPHDDNENAVEVSEDALLRFDEEEEDDAEEDRSWRR